MNTKEINSIAENAQMIVCGYAFSRAENHFIRVVNLHAPFRKIEKGATLARVAP